MTGGVRHLYVHLPFCAHRCGYCDFVTVVGRGERHGAYVDALLAELELEGDVLAARLETIFLGGGTPTFTEQAALARLLAALPEADELTVEANPETVTSDLAQLLRESRVDRVSLGAQSFQPHLLAVLERQAGPDDVRRAVYRFRGAGFDNISFDLLYGIPGQSPADLEHDLAEATALEPEHLSCYELEAKPGTRFTHAHGAELECQAESMEGYFERVVETLTAAGYRWYETANFCLEHERAGGRRRNLPGLGGYALALRAGEPPPREIELLDPATRARERLLLGLRLDDPLLLDDVAEALDRDAVERLATRGLVELAGRGGASHIALTRRGRFLGGGVTAELMELASS
jgi:oxygen-independent coproporphyrinogen-3 oxidase